MVYSKVHLSGRSKEHKFELLHRKYSIITYNLPVSPCAPGGPGLPVFPIPGGPGGPLKSATMSSICSEIKQGKVICDSPESFVRGGPLTTFFLSLRRGGRIQI